MKKILFISPNKLFGKNGGSIGQRKIYYSLKNLSKKYSLNINVISLDNDLNESILFIEKNKKLDIISRFLGYSNYLNLYKKRIINLIKKHHYDVVILGNSRLGTLAKIIKKRNLCSKVVTHFDNVEYDYCESVYQNSGFFRKIILFFEQHNIKKDEMKSIKYSDTIFCLSKRDKSRLEEIYHYNLNNKFIIYPICINTIEKLNYSNQHNLIFVGTLNYASNISAIKDFLPIFLKQKFFSKLVIGGSHATDEVRNLIINYSNVILKENFNYYSEIASKGDVLVSFIKKGAGMKVKVAEAMSMGLLVCGTTENFIGYEDVLNANCGLFKCDTEEEIVNALYKISLMNHKEIQYLANKNIELFNSHFSIEKSDEILEKILK